MIKSISSYFVLSVLVLMSPWGTASDWTVHPGERISKVMDSAKPGDTIRIQRGRYQENLVIHKRLNLVGVNRPTIDGGGKGDVIRVESPDVEINGLIVTNSGGELSAQNAGVYITPGSHRVTVENCFLVYNLFGLWIEGVDNPVVKNNVIVGKRDYQSAQRGNGVQLYRTNFAKILNNEISFVRDGLYVDVSHHALFDHNRIHNVRYGTHYMNSYFNTWQYNDSYNNRGGLALMEVRNQVVRYNRAWNNTDHGIMLRTIQDSIVEGNTVAGNNRGLFIYDAEYNTIKNNLVINNRVGVHLWAGSTRNKVFGNDFVGNREQVRYVGSQDEFWGGDMGNYWSNYMGWDRNGDGIGDIPYAANDVVDRLSWRHPLMKLLMGGPAVQTLRMVAQQFPILRATSVVDDHPHMQPFHKNWRKWFGK